ncbi:MAG: sel1 repeat family protein [Thermoleophilia bacterium]|nr:sel1 repeat family protein [Thermoleophilia bacterium]
MAAPRDPGTYDENELETSIVRGRLDVGLLRARAWCDDPQAMCMYADWLLHRATTEVSGELALDDVAEARAWLQRAVATGSRRAAGMLGDVLLDYARLPDDRRAGASLLRGAAFGGDVAAMRRLGVRCLVDGAAEQARFSGDADAERRDAAEARRWLMRAAGRGDERSAELLASFDDLFD